MRALELKLPPVAIVLLLSLAMWLLSKTAPAAAFTIPGSRWLALITFTGGLAAGLAGVHVFRGARTTVDPRAPHRTTSLVTAGIYRRSRNPMYLGLLLVLIAWAIYISNIFAFILLPVYILYMNRFQIGPEESHMREKFGEEYDRYSKTVRRWL